MLELWGDELWDGRLYIPTFSVCLLLDDLFVYRMFESFSKKLRMINFVL